MGKRRRHNGRSTADLSSRPYDASQSKLTIRTYEDVADSEDEFHLNRDKVLLEETPVRKKQRKLQEDEQFFEASDEEVLSAPDEDESDLEDDYLSDEDGEEADGRKAAKPQRGGHDSASASSPVEEDELEDGWGDSKRDYYDADAIETEADALEEEKEALRLQKKRLQGMSEADFGFDEIEWLEAERAGLEDNQEVDPVQELTLQPEMLDSLPSEEKSRIMASRYPEFEPLAQEFLSLQPLHAELMRKASASQSVNGHSGLAQYTENRRSLSAAEVKASALSSYLGVLSMYFALLTAGPELSHDQYKAKPPSELRDHPIMDALLSCRNLWSKVKDIQMPDTKQGDLFEIEERIPTIDADHQPDGTAEEKHEDLVDESKKRGKRRKIKAQKDAELAIIEADTRRATRLQRTRDDLAKISLSATSRKVVVSSTAARNDQMQDEDNSDFGEDTSLTAHEAAEKDKRRRSLRFYTSQITQKSNKRGTAGRDAGGDADIPYRERLKDRQARLNAEAEARGKKPKDTPGAALGGDSDEEDRRIRKEMRDGDEGDDYYEKIASRTKEKKASKEAFAAAQKEAALRGSTVYPVEEVGPDGKRAISYTIEKNKGLTPKRKKDVRNPRVKKRKKFEEKKKKLGSIRQIYKGGEGRGGYGGELTGIKTNLVKSVKL